MKRTVVLILAAAGVMIGQEMPLPSADYIKVVQEREAHESAVAERIEHQLERQPKPEPQSAPAVRHLSPKELKDLDEALKRYFREHPGQVPILWTPPSR